MHLSSLARGAAVAVLALAACTAEPTAAPTPEPRIAEVQAARQVVAEPAAALATATAKVVDATRALRTASDLAPDAGIAGLASAVDGLSAARADLASITVGGDGPDVAAARQALDEAATAAGEVLDAVAAEREEVTTLTSIDGELLALTTAWDEPGSRSAQLDRLAEVDDEADAMASALADRNGVHPCADVFGRRAAAAEGVATTTRELADYVRVRDGAAFDARRAELAADPLGTSGSPLWVEDARALSGCWDAAAPVLDAAAAVSAALADLQAALNPADLSSEAP